MLSCQSVFETIEALREDYFGLLEKICNIESNSADFEGVRKVCEVLCQFATERGFSVRKQAYENAGACAIIEMNAHASKKPIMFSGHMDTVYAKGAFGDPPAHREGNMLYGPGTADCKGGIVTALLAMDALKACGFEARPVRLFLQCDEEVGSRYSKKKSLEWMLKEAKQCAAFFNCENGRPGKITVARKGILKMVVGVFGKAAHAKDFFSGASAVMEAGYKLVRLYEACEQDGLAYNCTLKAMDMPSNTVPDTCEIVVDVRVRTLAQARQAEAFVERVAAECKVPGTSGQVLSKGMRPPMEPCEKNERLLKTINEICEKSGLPTYAPFVSAGGADASNVSQEGVPCVDSMGIEGELYHTPLEKCNLDSMAPRAKTLAAVALFYPE